MSITISCYIICKNEERNIEACIKSVSFCDQIVVVDSLSTDRTVEIVKSLDPAFKIDFYQREWEGYSAQKQFALEQCTGQWCLCIDADERVEPDFVPVLQRTLANTDSNGFILRWRPFLYGYGYAHKWTRLTGALRLTRQGCAQYNLERSVHESMTVDGKTEKLSGTAILHRGAAAFADQLQKEGSYARLKANDRFVRGKRAGLARFLLNPPFYFLKSYVLNRYFLSGRAGFIHSVRLMIYAFATETILYQLHRNEVPSGMDDPDKQL